MAKEIYIPGLTAPVSDKEAIKVEEERIAEIRREVADKVVTAKEQRSKEAQSLLDEVQERCREGDGPIEVTQEMKDLGIEDQVRGMIASYDLALPFMRMLRDDDD
jgi:poly(A) polymerase Pap1